MTKFQIIFIQFLLRPQITFSKICFSIVLQHIFYEPIFFNCMFVTTYDMHSTHA